MSCRTDLALFGCYMQQYSPLSPSYKGKELESPWPAKSMLEPAILSWDFSNIHLLASLNVEGVSIPLSLYEQDQK